MGRTNVVVDDVLVERVKRMYGLRTTRQAIDLALRRLVGEMTDDPHGGLLLDAGAEVLHADRDVDHLADAVGVRVHATPS